jgi:hypothetical protein
MHYFSPDLALKLNFISLNSVCLIRSSIQSNTKILEICYRVVVEILKLNSAHFWWGFGGGRGVAKHVTCRVILLDDLSLTLISRISSTWVCFNPRSVTLASDHAWSETAAASGHFTR